MMNGPAIEYLATLEHSRLINDPTLSRRAQHQRELSLLHDGAPADERGGRRSRLGLTLGRLGGLFVVPRSSAGHA